jgi:hypothetical protein
MRSVSVVNRPSVVRKLASERANYVTSSHDRASARVSDRAGTFPEQRSSDPFQPNIRGYRQQPAHRGRCSTTWSLRNICLLSWRKYTLNSTSCNKQIVKNPNRKCHPSTLPEGESSILLALSAPFMDHALIPPIRLSLDTPSTTRRTTRTSN